LPSKSRAFETGGPFPFSASQCLPPPSANSQIYGPQIAKNAISKCNQRFGEIVYCFKGDTETRSTTTRRRCKCNIIPHCPKRSSFVFSPPSSLLPLPALFLATHSRIHFLSAIYLNDQVIKVEFNCPGQVLLAPTLHLLNRRHLTGQPLSLLLHVEEDVGGGTNWSRRS
jgi:hypothetical protein